MLLGAGLHPALRHLVRAGLVEGTALAITAGRAPSSLGAALGAKVVSLDDLEDEQGHYRTVLDLAGPPTAPAARARHVRRLADVVETAGFLHVLCPSAGDGEGGIAQADLLRAFRRGWTLLSLHETWTGSDGRRRHAWLASFVHGPVRRRRPAPAVRHFTDLGAFGSLDLGAAADRPPWGT